MSTPDLSRPGVWTELFPHALELMAEFNAIDTLGFQRPFSECLAQAHRIIEPILARVGR